MGAITQEEFDAKKKDLLDFDHISKEQPMPCCSFSFCKNALFKIIFVS